MKKRFGICAITLVIVGLMISSVASVPAKETTSETEITAEYAFVECKPLALKTAGVMRPLSLSGVQVTGGDYDEFHPSVGGSPEGGFFALAECSEDGAIWQPWLLGSDDGVTWNPLLKFLYDDAEYTDMDQNAHGTYGTFGAPPDDTGLIVVLQGEILDGLVWDFGPDNINEFSNNRIDCYTFEGPDGDPGTWNWGGLTLTGYNGWGGNDIDGCPFIFYQNSEGGGGIIGWLTGGVSGCEHIGSAMDLVTNMHYAIYDRDTGGGNYDLIVRKDDFGTWVYNPVGDSWTHPYLASVHISDTANLTYPSAAAHDNNVIVACQKDSDVIVYYSANGFNSYTEVLVETSASYPEVVMDGEGNPFVTYIKDNVLYYRVSTDGGATWSDSEVVSDNQVNLNDRAANLDEYDGDIYGIWEDTRGVNIDIYFGQVYETTAPKLDIISIKGPIGVTATIKNIGDAKATNVKWTIAVTGGLLGFINKDGTGTEETLAIDGEIAVKSGILLGFGPITITVTAECAEDSSDEESASGTQIIIFSLVS